MSSYAIAQNTPGGIQLRGGAKEMWQSKSHEICLDGPAESGKTFPCCLKIMAMLAKYPKAQAAMVRAYRADLVGTVVQTWEKVAAKAIQSKAIVPFGGKHPERYDFWNGSTLWLGGLDRPGSVLSSERDIVYICQMEQVKKNSYEYITSRVTGRAGNTPYPQIVGDVNPGPPNHWIIERAKAGSLKMLKSVHRDNPRLHDGTTWTSEGRQTLEILERLTGIRKKRLLYGLWVGNEGLVYEGFDYDKHTADSYDIDGWKRRLAIDWGYRDPLVIQWWASRGEKHVMYREIYKTGMAVEAAATLARKLSANEKIEWAVCDHDAQNRLSFIREWPELELKLAHKGKGSIEKGIHDYVEPELEAGNLIFLRNALVSEDMFLKNNRETTCTVEEFANYSYPEDKEGRPRKEEPIDAYNHGMDCIRYYLRQHEIEKRNASFSFGGY